MNRSKPSQTAPTNGSFKKEIFVDILDQYLLLWNGKPFQKGKHLVNDAQEPGSFEFVDVQTGILVHTSKKKFNLLGYKEFNFQGLNYFTREYKSLGYVSVTQSSDGEIITLKLEPFLLSITHSVPNSSEPSILRGMYDFRGDYLSTTDLMINIANATPKKGSDNAEKLAFEFAMDFLTAANVDEKRIIGLAIQLGIAILCSHFTYREDKCLAADPNGKLPYVLKKTDVFHDLLVTGGGDCEDFSFFSLKLFLRAVKMNPGFVPQDYGIMFFGDLKKKPGYHTTAYFKYNDEVFLLDGTLPIISLGTPFHQEGLSRGKARSAPVLQTVADESIRFLENQNILYGELGSILGARCHPIGIINKNLEYVNDKKMKLDLKQQKTTRPASRGLGIPNPPPEKQKTVYRTVLTDFKIVTFYKNPKKDLVKGMMILDLEQDEIHNFKKGDLSHFVQCFSSELTSEGATWKRILVLY